MKKSELKQIIKEEISKILNENEIQDLFTLNNQNRQITLDLRKLTNSEFEEFYNSLNNNPDIYRISTYGKGFIEVDLNELNDENKSILLKYKNRIKVK